MICGVGLASLFLIEIAPIEKRGWTGSLIQIFRGLGGTAGMALALPQVMGNRQWFVEFWRNHNGFISKNLIIF